MDGVFLTFQDLFKKLLDFHEKKGYLRNKRIKKILGEIPLEILFNEEQLKQFVLSDKPVLFYYRDENNVRTVSAPHMISMIITLLDLKSSDTVLILGSKGGLMETAIAKSCRKVFIVEQHDEVAALTEEAFIKLGLKNVWIRRENPYYGLEDEGPFSKILVTGAISYIPSRLLDQLMLNGIIVFPMMIYHPQYQKILQIIKKENSIEILNYGAVMFSDLYSTKVPKIDIELDLTIQKMIKLNQNISKQDLLTLPDFFLNHDLIPNLKISNIFFSETESISQKLQRRNQSPEPDNSKFEKVKEIAKNVEVVIFNPYKIPIEINLHFYFSACQNRKKHQKILLNPKNNTNITHQISIPLIENRFLLNIIATTMNSDNIFHQEIFLHLSQFDEGWIATLEL